MLQNYILIIFTYIIFTYIIGQINFNEKKKRKFLIATNSIYNGLLGYISIRIIGAILTHFANIPTHDLGTNTLPEVNEVFNMLIGTCSLILLLFFLIPINKYVCEKSVVAPEIYIIIMTIALIAGVFISLLV